VLLRFLGVGYRLFVGLLVVAFPKECRQAFDITFNLDIGPGAIGLRGTQRLGHPAGTGEKPLGLLGHLRLLEMVDELRRRLAFGFAHGFQNAGLGNTTQVIVDGRSLAGGRHVEVHGARDCVGVSEAPRASVPRLMDGVDTERGTMREERRLAVAVESHQSLPQTIFVLGQLLCPLLVAGLDRLGRGAIRRDPVPGC